MEQIEAQPDTHSMHHPASTAAAIPELPRTLIAQQLEMDSPATKGLAVMSDDITTGQLILTALSLGLGLSAAIQVLATLLGEM